MNKFKIFSCIKVKENDYDGPCVILSCTSDPEFLLFFPVSEENAKVISYVLDGNEDYDVNTNILGIYKTMVDSWRSSDRYLSGIIMDSTYNSELKDDVLMIRLAIAGDRGNIDSLVRVNFLHAILLAAMEEVDIIVSDELIMQMIPPSSFDDEDGDEDEDSLFSDDKEMNKKHQNKNKKKHPSSVEDHDIVEIAKKIMSGKVQEKPRGKNSKGENSVKD